ncbi:MAG: D-alanyl-D-alanine carboxypeptidase, partial [Ruminococcus sp.]|nr:D-alanyl-D-alanine carboxypeptidase [Ruminococcus sp.]
MYKLKGKRILSLCLAFIFTVFTFSFNVSVSALSAEEITAPSAVLIEPTTKKVLFEKNPHDSR